VPKKLTWTYLKGETPEFEKAKSYIMFYYNNFSMVYNILGFYDKFSLFWSVEKCVYSVSQKK